MGLTQRERQPAVRTLDDELIARARAGDDEAFCELVRHYERRIYALAFFYCRDSHDAEDLSQEVWLKAYKAMASFKGESTFYTWLRRITINTFLNDRRARPASKSESQSAARSEPFDVTDSPGRALFNSPIAIEDSMINQVMFGSVMQALSQLSPHQRMIFLLKHQEGMTYAEIAAEMDCSVGAVKKALFRAVSKLREQLYVSAQSEDYISLVASEELG
jgi:RNA polymerase sigma-70 factor (ECF subfamily)